MLLAIIDTLPAKDKEVCRLRLIENRSADEAVRFLGVSKPAVSTRLHREASRSSNALRPACTRKCGKEKKVCDRRRSRES